MRSELYGCKTSKNFMIIMLFFLSIQSCWASKVALVVGNSSYSDRPLKNPINDAELMQSTLKKLGFEVTVLKNADRKAMLNGLRNFEKKAKDSELAVFYFAGHGTQIYGNNYLIPVSSNIKSESDVVDEAIDAGSVLKRLEDSRAKVGLIILDACRDNPYSGSSRSSSRGLSRMNAPSGTIVAFSTAAGQTADDGPRKNGVYTEQLAKNLLISDLDIREIFDRTAKAVEYLTEGRQRPREDIALREKVYLSAINSSIPNINSFQSESLTFDNVPIITEVEPQQVDVFIESEAWALAKKRDTEQAYRSYLEHFPNGQYASVASMALKGLSSISTPTVISQVSRIPEKLKNWIGTFELKYAGGFVLPPDLATINISFQDSRLNVTQEWDSTKSKRAPVVMKEIDYDDSVIIGLHTPEPSNPDFFVCFGMKLEEDGSVKWASYATPFSSYQSAKSECQQYKNERLNEVSFNAIKGVGKKTSPPLDKTN